jgi:hydrogenase expression/formation protein HypE
MRIGKLTNEQLKSVVFSRLHPKHDILLRSGVGEDCAAIDFGGEACVLSTDPVTGAVENLGKLAVDISCNDIASSGARPYAMLLTMLVPPDKNLEDIEKVMDQLAEESDRIGVDIIGGHTEVTDAVTRIVLSATVIGRIETGKIIKSSGAGPGDDIIMTGFAAMEGTYIIANDWQEQIEGILSDDDRKALGSLGASISVVEEGVLAGLNGATAMHDVTEGGVYGAIYELCEASGVGCEIYKEKIPILDVTIKICDKFSIDPYRLIGSGSMLITSKNSSALIEIFNENGIKAEVIGNINGKGIYVIDNGNKSLIKPPEADELFSL